MSSKGNLILAIMWILGSPFTWMELQFILIILTKRLTRMIRMIRMIRMWVE